MKKNLIIILCAVAFGGGIAFYIFNLVVEKPESKNMMVVNAFQVGAFTNYDNALKVANRNNGVVVNDDNIFRVYVAILNDPVAVKKMKDYYAEIGLNYYLKQIDVSKEFIEQISINEELLKKSSSDVYGTINLEVLNLYKEML